MKPEILQKTLSALGLCRRAGKCVFGTEIVCDALRTKQNVCLVVCPEDNSENTQKKLRDKCTYYKIELLQLPVSGEDFAKAVGKAGHCAAMGVTDRGFSELIQKTIEKD